MLQIVVIVMGVVCLCQKEIKVNKTRVVRGMPVKFLGLLLLAVGGGVTSFLAFIDIASHMYVLFAALAVVVIYIIAIIVYCSEPIEVAGEVPEEVGEQPHETPGE